MYYMGNIALLDMMDYFSGSFKGRNIYSKLSRNGKYRKIVVKLKNKDIENALDYKILQSINSRVYKSEFESHNNLNKVPSLEIEDLFLCFDEGIEEIYNDENLTIYMLEKENIPQRKLRKFMRYRDYRDLSSIVMIVLAFVLAIKVVPIIKDMYVGTTVENVTNFINMSHYSEEIKDNIREVLGLDESFDEFDHNVSKAYIYSLLIDDIKNNDDYNIALLLNEEQRVDIKEEIHSNHDNMIVKELDNNLYLKLDEFNSWRYDIKTKRNHYENIVLDLRDNEGGKAVGSSQLLSNFMSKEDVNDLMDEVFGVRESRPYKIYNEIMYDRTPLSYDKLQILVNKDSASASEYVADVLKAYNPDKITIIGEETFGKVETIVILVDGKSLLAYTTGVLNRLSGSKTRKIIPDIVTNDFSKYILE